MMSNKVIVTAIIVLLASVAISEGMSLRSLGVALHCRCIQKESRRIGRLIEKIELIRPNSHCDETEIIATLKKTGERVCLDPKAPWLQGVITTMISNTKP